LKRGIIKLWQLLSIIQNIHTAIHRRNRQCIMRRRLSTASQCSMLRVRHITSRRPGLRLLPSILLTRTPPLPRRNRQILPNINRMVRTAQKQPCMPVPGTSIKTLRRAVISKMVRSKLCGWRGRIWLTRRIFPKKPCAATKNRFENILNSTSARANL